MTELSGFYAIWLREYKIFLREKSRIVASIVSPLLWLFIFGGGLGAQFTVANVNYRTFIYPGILVMTVLFSSIFYGAYVIWDKRLDFLKGVLVAPMSRVTIFLGKVIGGVTDALLQALIIMIFAPLVGIPFSWNFIPIFLVLFVLVIAIVSIGLIFGSVVDSPEGFGLIMSFVNMPLFFLSGALYPLDQLPGWLAFATKLNPVTYGVDAIRGLMLGINVFNLFLDLAVLVGFDLALICIGVFAFKRMKI